MPGVAAQSREWRGGSLFARLSAWLLFWLTSASPGDPTSAPATEHTCETGGRGGELQQSWAGRGTVGRDQELEPSDYNQVAEPL